jgi:class 3 adenylate cyclase
VADDALGTAGLDEMRHLPDRFGPPERVGKIAPLPHRYWVRFRLRNADSTDVRIGLAIDSWDDVQFYVIHHDGSVVGLVSGMRHAIRDPQNFMREPRPFDAMPEAARNDASSYASFVLRAGEEVVVFARVGTSGLYLVPTFRVNVVRLEDFLERARFRLYFDGITIGILFGLAVYNLVIGVAVRDRSYAWFAVYALAIATSLAGLLGPSTSNLMRFVLPDHPFAAIVIKRISEPLTWIALLCFTRDFFHTRKRMPSFDRLILAMIALLVVDFVAYSLRFQPVQQQWFYVVAVAICLAVGCIAFRNGHRSGYFIAGQVVVLIGLAEFTLTQYGGDLLAFLPNGGFIAFLKGSTSVFIASTVNALIFSVALTDRFRGMAIEQQTLLETVVAERTTELRAAVETSRHLLHNILPESVAAELTDHGASKPHRFDDVSILFTDFKDFTTLAGLMPPYELVNELDQIFGAFDEITAKHGVEKIKTIGDAYFAVAGLPIAYDEHAQRCIAAALDMMEYIAKRNETAAVKWDMRAGVHSGTVIAGVVGKRKFTYDVWGDSVNIAARIQANGDPGSVSISAYTYHLVRSKYACAYRGKVALKGKGQVDMYVVSGPA